MADWLEEREDPRAAVMRLGVQLRRQVGGIAFPDQNDAFWTESEGWAALQRPLEKLIEESPPRDELRHRYSQLLRGEVPLDPENLEATLRLQYDLQVRMLESLGILKDSGITAIDGKSYPLPSFEDILTKVQGPDLQTKVQQAFDTLLLVPFGLDLQRLITAWGEGLRRNQSRVPELRNLNQRNPVWVWEQYRREPIAYRPTRFEDDHGGLMKDELLEQKGRGWDVLLVEGMTEIPHEGRGKIIGGRRQIECGLSPEQYLRTMPAGEIGWTPESYIVRFLDALERSGTVLDRDTATFLTDAFFPSSRGVPSGYWGPVDGRAGLGRCDPGFVRAYVGARAAVRVR